jgi:TPR repeat protein
MPHKKLCALLFSIVFMAVSNITYADWFTSDEITELITKADAGDVDAQFRVGTAYDFGNGAPHDGEKAMKYYLMAAKQGLAEAQNSVGSGLQAEKRYAEAMSWYERAAAQSHPLATNSLAYLYDLGLGVPQNRTKGFELYSRAADLGWAEAMWNLANMYGSGQIGKTDMVMACVWVVRAQRFAPSGDPQLTANIARTLPRLGKTLSSEDWGTCQQQGNSWTPQQPKQ